MTQNTPAFWIDEPFVPGPGILVCADLHLPLPNVPRPFTVVRNELDAPEGEISVVSPLSRLELNTRALARGIADAWFDDLCPWFQHPDDLAGEERFHIARARLAEFCTREEQTALYRVEWAHVLAEAQRSKRADGRQADNILSGNHGPGDLLDGYTPKSKRLRARIEDERDFFWHQVRRIGDVFLASCLGRRKHLIRLMEEPPHNVTKERAHNGGQRGRKIG